MRRWMVPLLCFAAWILLESFAMRFPPPANAADPREAWHALPVSLKLLISGGYLAFIAGIGTLVLAVRDSVRGRRGSS